MEQDGHLKSLVDRLREKAEQERIETEQLFSNELKTLSASLQASSQNALHTMEDAITHELDAATERLTEHYQVLSMAYGRAWLRTAITALAILFGLVVGTWILTSGAAYWLQSYRAELSRMKAKCREQQKTLELLRTEAWGMDLLESKNGRFVVFPPGVIPDPKKLWNVGERKALKLE